MTQSNDKFFMEKIEALERRVSALESRQSFDMQSILRKPQSTWTEKEARMVAAWQESWCARPSDQPSAATGE